MPIAWLARIVSFLLPRLRLSPLLLSPSNHAPLTPETRQKSPPNHLKSFLEKTLNAHEAPKSTPQIDAPAATPHHPLTGRPPTTHAERAMSDYQPLNLTALSNASADLLGPNGADTLGPQAYRGVPFHIGDPASAQLPLLGDGGHTGAVRIDIAQTAHTLVFAHVLVDPQLHRSGVPGDHVATYVIHHADGQKPNSPSANASKSAGSSPPRT